MLYPYALLAFGLVCASLTIWTWRACRPAGKAVWEKLPRHIALGMVLGAVDLAWCVPHAEPVFYIGAWRWLLPLACALLVVAYSFTDYHFSRALAGFLILLAHYFLLESFAAHSPIKGLFSFLCVVMGTAGVFIGGMPYLLRDLIRKVCDSTGWRAAIVGLMAIYAAVSIILGVFHLVK